jgi:hypothetical protein
VLVDAGGPRPDVDDVVDDELLQAARTTPLHATAQTARMLLAHMGENSSRRLLPIRTDGTVGWFQAVRGATALKRAHDPGNRFAYNHNIKPAPVERA